MGASAPYPMADFIVTMDVYVFNVRTKQDAIDQVMAGIERGGLEADVLVAQEGEPPDEPQAKAH